MHPSDAHGVERRVRLGVVVGELAGIGPQGLGLEDLGMGVGCGILLLMNGVSQSPGVLHSRALMFGRRDGWAEADVHTTT